MASFDDVKKFHKKFGLLVADQPRHLTHRKLIERAEFLREEFSEFLTSAGLEVNNKGEFVKADSQDMAGMADALVDLVYVALGTAVMMGLPWDELWDDVQRANMAKVRGISHRGHAVDCVKPPGWVGPKTDAILAQAGYVKDEHSKEENHADDEL